MRAWRRIRRTGLDGMFWCLKRMNVFVSLLEELDGGTIMEMSLCVDLAICFCFSF